MKIPRKMKKQFKKDDGWFSTSIGPIYGFLPVQIHCIMSYGFRKGFKHDMPRLRFSNYYENYYERYGKLVDVQDCLVMTLDGKILSGEKLNISQKDVDTLKRWVVQHKQALLRHFKGMTCSFGLLKELGLL